MILGLADIFTENSQNLSSSRFWAGDNGAMRIALLLGFVALSAGAVEPLECSLPISQNDEMTTKGRQIFRGATEFIARGVVVRAFLIPEAQVNRCLETKNLDSDAYKLCSGFKTAREFYKGLGVFADGKDSMCVAIRDWNINAVRFNLNQVALDSSPGNLFYDAEYVKEVQAAVERARQRGLIVFLALFDLGLEKAPLFMLKANPKSAMNNQSTLGAAKKLAKMFMNDRGVVIELLNEPYATPYDKFKDAWQVWLKGESPAYQKSNAWKKMKFVGVNKILSQIRAMGAKNLIGLPALGSSFEHYPGGVVDPGVGPEAKANHFFVAHPFLSQLPLRERDWFTRFGEFAKSNPFVLTAFGALAVNPWCRESGILNVQANLAFCEEKARQYLQYLSDSKIGFFGFGIDVPNSMVRDFEGSPRRFDIAFDETLGKDVVVGSAGKLIQNLFTNNFETRENQAPQISILTPPTLAWIGSSLKFRVDAADFEGDPMTFQVSWGDEAGTSGTARVFSARSYSRLFEHVYSKYRSNPHKVIVRAFDSKGASTELSFDLRLVNRLRR